MANNAILKEGFVALSGALLLTSPQLQELNLAGNNLGILGAVCVSSMLQRRNFSSLRQFDISNNALGAPGWLVHTYKYWAAAGTKAQILTQPALPGVQSIFSALVSLPSLRSVSVKNNCLGAYGPHLVAQQHFLFHSLSHLRTLEID